MTDRGLLPCSLYVFTTDEIEGSVFVKVGISRSPQARVASVQTGCPLRIASLRVIGTPNLVVAKALEAALHKTLELHHTCGEWFRLDSGSELLQDAIAEHVGGRGWTDRVIPLADAKAMVRADMKAKKQAYWQRQRDEVNRRRITMNLAPIKWD